MKTVPFTADLLKFWDGFVKDNPCGTIYHDSAWIKLVQDVFGYKQKGFLFTEDKAILGGLLLFEVNGFRNKRLVSNPFRDRGGLLVKEGVDLRPIFDKSAQLLREGGYSYLLIKEENPITLDLINEFSLKESTVWITTKVDLTLGKDNLWKILKNNAAGPVKQAKSYGVKIYKGESLKDMDAFYDIFLRSRKLLGIPSFPRRFFVAIWNTLCLQGKAVFFLAVRDDRPIAGVVLLIFKDTVLDGYAASLLEYRHLRANDLLIWESIAWAIRGEYHWFDFGADSLKQEGLLAFKRKWNGTHKAMHHYFLLKGKADIDNMDSSEEKYRLFRKGMSKLPLSLFSWVSDRVVSYLG